MSCNITFFVRSRLKLHNQCQTTRALPKESIRARVTTAHSNLIRLFVCFPLNALMKIWIWSSGRCTAAARCSSEEDGSDAENRLHCTLCICDQKKRRKKKKRRSSSIFYSLSCSTSHRLFICSPKLLFFKLLAFSLLASGERLLAECPFDQAGTSRLITHRYFNARKSA